MPKTVLRMGIGIAYDGTATAATGAIPRRVALRQCKYLNNVIEQDHRTVKKRVWLAKGDVAGQALFIGELFGLAAWPELRLTTRAGRIGFTAKLRNEIQNRNFIATGPLRMSIPVNPVQGRHPYRCVMCPLGGHSAPLWLIGHGSETATPKLPRQDITQSSRMPRRTDVD
jgi:hypothetical protein